MSKEFNLGDYNQYKAIIDSMKNLKHRAILALSLYGGLRRVEIVNLKVKDVYFDELKVRNNKSVVVRRVKLDDKLYKILKDYLRIYKSSEFLFKGQNNQQMTNENCTKIFKKKLSPNNKFKSLRLMHFAKRYNEGATIQEIQYQAGYRNVKEAMVFINQLK